MAKTDEPKPDDPKPDQPQGAARADGELAHAYEQLRSADEDLARLDRLVSGMERGDGPAIPQGGAGAAPGGATVNEAPASRTSASKTSASTTLGIAASHPGLRRSQPVLLALAGFLLAVGLVGAAFASRYGHEAKAIMARWAPPAATAHKAASEPPTPAQSLIAQAANAATDQAAGGARDAGKAPSPPAAPGKVETKDAASTGATPSTELTSADVTQLLKSIAQGLASIDEKLEQLKSSHDQTLREHGDSIAQLKTTQEQNARDNARLAAQVQALQAQLAALSAKSSTQSVKKETEAAPRQRQSVAASRPRRLMSPWRRLPPYMDEPWDDYW